MKIHAFDPELESDSRKGAVVNTVVLHWTAGGGLKGAIATLSYRSFSYHYLIDRDGTIWKCIPTNRAGRHVGWDVKGLVRSRGPNGPGTVNRTSIGISFVNWGDGEPLSDLQLAAARDLIRSLKAAIPTLRYLTTHHECAPRARPTELKAFPLESFGGLLDLKAWRRA